MKIICYIEKKVTSLVDLRKNYYSADECEACKMCDADPEFEKYHGTLLEEVLEERIRILEKKLDLLDKEFASFKKPIPRRFFQRGVQNDRL